jgi:cytochrome c oxidase subunit 3
LTSTENTGVKTIESSKSVRLGFWLFLFCELLLIGGMLIVFALNKLDFTAEFRTASLQLSPILGAFNTFLLITGTSMFALSVISLKKEKKYLSIFLQFLAIIFAVWFLLNRWLELNSLWLAGFSLSDEKFLQKVPGEILFFKFFYAMNLVHIVHVFATVLIVKLASFQIIRNRITSESYDKIQGAGVFYHIVTIMWLFFYPLFYLLA